MLINDTKSNWVILLKKIIFISNYTI